MLIMMLYCQQRKQQQVTELIKAPKFLVASEINLLSLSMWKPTFTMSMFLKPSLGKEKKNIYSVLGNYEKEHTILILLNISDYTKCSNQG